MRTPQDRKTFERMFRDPEPHDEDNAAYKLELFETLKYMGHKPEDLRNDPSFADEYREWLKNNFA
jgi:hypothetical protein